MSMYHVFLFYRSTLIERKEIHLLLLLSLLLLSLLLLLLSALYVIINYNCYHHYLSK